MDINPEIRDRILAAAAQLFEQAGRKELPTVDAVRKLSRTSMNDASAVMREWRRAQIVSASAAVVAVPERVALASQQALSALWSEAQELANESLNVAQAAWDAERAEAEKLRVELSSAFETQGAELEAVEQGGLRQQVIVLTDKAHTSMARAEEIEKRAEDLKAALATAQGAVSRLTAELEAERQQHGLSRDGLAALSTELVTVKARAEAQAGVQEGQGQRLRSVEAELAQARAAAAAAREEAAHLRGQTEALHTQQAELIQALKLRDGAAGKVKKP